MRDAQHIQVELNTRRTPKLDPKMTPKSPQNDPKKVSCYQLKSGQLSWHKVRVQKLYFAAE